jgi:hypothetical protein
MDRVKLPGDNSHDIVASIDNEEKILNQGSVLEAMRIKITAPETNGVINHLRFISVVYAGKPEGDPPDSENQCKQAHQQQQA